MKSTKKNAFTLVELIVVIIILAILGTIAFISLQGYSSQARDSKRLTDIQNIKKSLELFSINTGKYPIPDNGVKVIYDSDLVWTQGTIGDIVTRNLSKNLQEKPLDPLTQTEYTYSVSGYQTEYELLSIYESDLYSYINIFNNANAVNAIFPKIDGNYNGIFVKTANYYIPTPSIINSEASTGNLILDNSNIKSQLITGGINNISYGVNPAVTLGLDGLTLQVFSGTISSDNDVNKYNFALKLIDAYSGCTLLANNGIYKDILNTSIDDYINLVDTIVLKSVNNNQNETIEIVGTFYLSQTTAVMGNIITLSNDCTISPSSYSSSDNSIAIISGNTITPTGLGDTYITQNGGLCLDNLSKLLRIRPPAAPSEF